MDHLVRCMRHGRTWEHSNLEKEHYIFGCQLSLRSYEGSWAPITTAHVVAWRGLYYEPN